jgi:hypothetical protein
MSITMLGETAYTLKDIEFNEEIKLSKLRKDIKNKVFHPSGKLAGAYYIVQSELDKYLSIVNKTIYLSDRQIDEMRHALGLDYKNKPYRNRFYCNSDDEKWNDLVKKGLALKGEYVESGHCYFWLNHKGVAYILGKSISLEVYKEL